jgi:hypothetical protein
LVFVIIGQNAFELFSNFCQNNFPFLGQAEDSALDGPLSQGTLGKENLCFDFLLQRTTGASGRSSQADSQRASTTNP